ncbi:MAG: tetratricopeptide repeat protein [Erysipelotrichaceae bacterium]|nr:tetratricopeptide repeat protein [Erysipelotrichaceae bacterium]
MKNTFNDENSNFKVKYDVSRSDGLRIGQKLYCLNGEVVVVCEIIKENIVVEYKSKKYSRNKNIVGVKLLLKPPLMNSTDTPKFNQSSNKYLVKSEIKIKNDDKNKVRIYGKTQDIIQGQSKCNNQDVSKNNNFEKLNVTNNFINLKGNEVNEYKQLKLKSDDKPIVKNDLKFLKSEKVKHSSFGIGTILENDGSIVKVDFTDGNILNFDYETCFKDKILRTVAMSETIDKMSLERLKHISDSMLNKKQFNYKALEINLRIIENDSDNTEYLNRLADCYKHLDLIEEAISIYNTILEVDNKNTVAKDNLLVLGTGLIERKKDKIFDGMWRDVFSPPTMSDDEVKKLNELFEYCKLHS